jgi:hypothetical protein
VLSIRVWPTEEYLHTLGPARARKGLWAYDELVFSRLWCAYDGSRESIYASAGAWR